MAADVSSVARMLRGYKEEGEGRRELVTRDLLGGSGTVLRSPEVDLELRVPEGWERRLDLLSGRTYLQKRDPNPVPRHLHDLKLALPPPSPASLFPDLDAAAAAAAPPSAAPSTYQSVCTLEKVKSALERAGREERPHVARRSDGSPSPPASSTTTSSSFKRRAADADGGGPELPQGGVRPAAAAMAVVGCPGCLLYVLVSAVEPRCPRCAAHVPVNSEPKKRPKFDLNTPTQEDDLN